MRPAIALILLASLSSSVGCNRGASGHAPSTWQQHEAEMRELDSKLKALAERIKAEQGRGQCKVTEQCHVVGLGAKVCGGYSDFLVYSDWDTHESELLARVAEFNAEAGKLNDRALAAAKCGTTPKAPECIEGRCQVR